MMWSDSDKVIISSLKGRLSKILGAKVKLTKVERATLENVYTTIDTMILKDDDKEECKQFLLVSLEDLANSKKNYVKEHIIPLIEKISKGEV